ncbi:MAG: hypothetical protein KGJ57_22865 [Sphingomonadales bacterium]|nr:hypothetical protein [Sphingomonadales bacterium]MDE2172228.1 hypothetical protein [Sphingomonadales bacterium]
MSLDYAPEHGKVTGDIAVGTVLSSFGKGINTARGAVERRLRVGGGTMPAHRSEVLLPPGAPDMLGHLDTLLDHYERSLLPSQRELVVIFTMRFPRDSALHDQWELARAFIRQHLNAERRLAVIAVQHAPGLAGFAEGKPHVHGLALARSLDGSNFGGFTPIAKAGAKLILANEWQAWRAARA